MARSKSGKRDEDYLGEIRNLKSENRRLKKEIKRLQRKEYTQEQDSYEDPEEETKVVERKVPCPECGKGFLEFKLVVGRHWSQCDQCSYRTKTKKL